MICFQCVVLISQRSVYHNIFTRKFARQVSTQVITQVYTRVFHSKFSLTFSRRCSCKFQGPTCHGRSFHKQGACAIVAVEFDLTVLRNAMGKSHPPIMPVRFSFLECFRRMDASWLVHFMSCVSCVARHRCVKQGLKMKSDCFLVVCYSHSDVLVFGDGHSKSVLILILRRVFCCHCYLVP